MQSRIFLSYRRDDSAGHAGRVNDRLGAAFERAAIFMDVESIPLGVNFATILSEEVAKCDVLLVLIGPHWLDAKDQTGARRLDNPVDFVRLEISAALSRNIPVIPVLLEGAQMPEAGRLPNDLKELSLRNGIEVRHASFGADINRLIRGISAHLPSRPRTGLDDSAIHPTAAPIPKKELSHGAKARHGRVVVWLGISAVALTSILGWQHYLAPKPLDVHIQDAEKGSTPVSSDQQFSKRTKILIGTNRSAFADSSVGHTQYGEVVIQIPDSHRIGAIETPRQFTLFGTSILTEKHERSRHFTSSRIAALRQERFVERLQSISATDQSSTATIYVHGWNMQLADAVNRAAQLQFEFPSGERRLARLVAMIESPS